MKTLTIIIGFLALQTCGQHKDEKDNAATSSSEYREKKTSKDIVADVSTSKDTKVPVANTEKKIAKDTILNNIQAKVLTASSNGFAKMNTQKLDELETLLETNNTSPKNLKNYWIAYINYYKTIIGLKSKNKELGENSNKKGIESIEKNIIKNSDDYALLVLLKGLSYSFVMGMEAGAVSADISKCIESGLEADAENFRIYYAQGSTDFYTPKMFGGGKIAEESLLKAINLPEKNLGNTQLPTWGKEESYDLIIKYYLRENQKENAKKYFDEAKKLFPNSYTIQAHQAKVNE